MTDEAGATTDARRPPQTERGLDRLVNFTDAVVAIAITLIVLPLVDVATEANSAASFLSDARGRLIGAALSFVVIAFFWRQHHAEMERAVRYSQPLLLLNLLWIATIAFLPVPTTLLFSDSTSDDGPGALATGLYIGTMLVSMLTMRVIQFEIIRRCADPDAPPVSRFRQAIDWVPLGLMAASFVGGVLLPGPEALFLMFLSFPIIRPLVVLHRRRRRRLGLPPE